MAQSCRTGGTREENLSLLQPKTMTLMTTQPNPNKRQHPPTPLGALLNKYAISLASLRDCLSDDGAKYHSRSTLHRLVNGRGITGEMMESDKSMH